MFPDDPILPEPPGERAAILEDDDWVTRSIIPGIFREMHQPENLKVLFTIGWRLGRVMNLSSRTPLWLVPVWPLFVPRAPFIGRIVEGHLDMKEPIDDMRNRHAAEFGERLKGGPFLGGRSAPSLADLSFYSQVEYPRLIGLPNPNPIWEAPEVAAWLEAMRPFMPARPPLLEPALV